MDDGRVVQSGGGTAYDVGMPALASYDPRFTAAEFERMALAAGFMDARLELRDGEIVKMSPIYVPHGDVHAVLFLLLTEAARRNLPDAKVRIEVSVSFSDYFQPLPDILIWDHKALTERPTGPVPGHAVRLIVEVSDSSLNDDLGAKLASYARSGVPEYWVADVARGRLFMHAQPSGDTYERREPFAFGNVVQALTLPLSIDTAELSNDSVGTERSS